MKKVILSALGISTTLGMAGLVCVGAVLAEEPQGSTTFNVNLATMLEVTAPSAVEIDVDPGSGTGIGTGTVDVTVATNNVTGYTLKMYAGNDAKLVNASDASQFISTLADADGESDALAGVNVGWGFKVTSNNSKAGTSFVTLHFQTIAAGIDNLQEIAVTDAPSNGDVTSLSFGVKVKGVNGLSAGIYNGVVNFVAVTNELPCAGVEIDGGICVPYMQDVDSAWKDNLALEEQTLVADKRDDKTYYVAKLADGNIWMTQNLDLDIPAAGLSATDTDITADWNSSSTYPPMATSTTVFNSSSNTGTMSYNGGNYYWNGQWDGSWGSGSSYGNFSKFSTTAPSQGDHYHVGNLYQWNAATAGTGGTITSQEATSSICPKGWRLPYSKDSTTDKSFGKLLTAYGATSDTSKIIASPLFFVPAGLVTSGSLSSAGDRGYYWSSMAASSSSLAYVFRFLSDGGVNPSGSSNRYYGFSVRCVAR